jgi:predicted nucleic acid-binding protein
LTATNFTSDSRFTLDSSILVYAFDGLKPKKQHIAVAILRRSRLVNCILTLQSLGEFYRAATGKLGVPPRIAAAQVRDWTLEYPVAETSTHALLAGLEAATRHDFSIWDTLILASAAEAGCTVCFSEDMADGARLGSIVVRNPFGRRGLSATARAVLGD